MDSLFKFVNGKATISEHTRNIWYYANLIDKYGEEVCCNIFTIFQYTADLNPATNPFVNVSEEEKLETIIRSVAPELDISIDWDDVEITECIELTRKLFSTVTYRKYLASKILCDKITYEIEHAVVVLDKEGGNSAELKKAYELFDMVNDQTKKLFQEYLDEQEGMVQVKGQGKQIKNRNEGGKLKELE